MPISSAGIGSGLDVNGIVTSLMEIEREPLNILNSKKLAYQAQVSAYGGLKGALSSFQSAIGTLSSTSKFNELTATSSDEATLTASANSKAVLGNYGIQVNQLAQQHKISFAGSDNIADPVGTGSITIEFGTHVDSPASFTTNTDKAAITIDIDGSNSSLAGIRDAINAQEGVVATIVNDGTNNNLVITATDTGESNSLKITVTDDDTNNLDQAGLSQLAYDPIATLGNGKNLTELQAAESAQLTIDGIAVTNESNTISEAIEGVTLNLLATNASPVNLDLAIDQENIKESIDTFVNAYNQLDSTLRSLTRFDESGNSGILIGDATVRTITNRIRNVMTQSIDTPGALTRLSQVGISFERDGKLALDETTLSTAITENFDDIAALFAPSAVATDALITFNGSTANTQPGIYAINVTQIGTDLVSVAGTINNAAGTGSGQTLVGAIGNNAEGLSLNINGGALGDRGTVQFSRGYAAQLDTMIEELLADEGLLAARTEGLDASIKRIDEQSEAFTNRLVSIEARYRAQYTRLDTLMATLQSTSSFLTQQINALSANSNNG